MQPHPSAENWIKALLSKALPTKARPSFSHHQSLPSRSLHKKKQEKAQSHSSSNKPYYRKLITMKKQKVMSEMKGQDKISEKQLNEVEIGTLPEKEFRIMIVKMIQGLRKRMEANNEKMQEMFTKACRN